MRMFDPRKTCPTVIEAGMWVRFHPVDRAEYDRLAAMANKGDVVVEHFTRESRPEEETRMKLTVRNPGMLTTVQDLGQQGTSR